ncbi:hypothetical protein HU200_013213 [Digitaria exilis]|uniref:RHOMBOID-like protein n=1 Tax=Digitaria exilis TaxID=1010633 RepID=A0A835FDL7_9POAL|nr:hypothetical protein HU200_013213 [Digitaria exilis]
MELAAYHALHQQHNLISLCLQGAEGSKQASHGSVLLCFPHGPGRAGPAPTQTNRKYSSPPSSRVPIHHLPPARRPQPTQPSQYSPMMKPGGARNDDEDVQVLVERPYSHETGPAPPRPPPAAAAPGHRHHQRQQQQQQQLIRARPYYRRWTPWIVSAATLACVAIFVVTMAVNDCPKHNTNCFAGFLGRFAFQPLKENPLLGPSSATIGLVYLISGFGGSLMSALFIQSTISVGASGALFGLIGSMLSELITNWSLYANKVAALVSLVLVIAVNLALGILPRVDNFAHIGGLISGFLLGFVFFIRPQFAWLNQRRVAAASAGGVGVAVGEQQQLHQQQQAARPVKQRKHKTYQYVLWLAAAVLLVVGYVKPAAASLLHPTHSWSDEDEGNSNCYNLKTKLTEERKCLCRFSVAIVLLFRGYNANEHCSWCHYLSCVPTKHWKCNSSPTVCTVTRQENTLTLTCQGTSKNQTYLIADASSQARINDLCNQLCV